MICTCAGIDEVVQDRFSIYQQRMLLLVQSTYSCALINHSADSLFFSSHIESLPALSVLASLCPDSVC